MQIFNVEEETFHTISWKFIVTKDLGGGYTAVSEGGPFLTREEAVLECGWVKNRMETYED